jgi:uncharacterized protein
MPLRRHLLAGAAFLAALPAQVHEAGAQAVKVRLGTATPGGGFPVYGAAFVEAVRRVDPGLEIEPINTMGSTECRARWCTNRSAASAGRRRI